MTTDNAREALARAVSELTAARERFESALAKAGGADARASSGLSAAIAGADKGAAERALSNEFARVAVERQTARSVEAAKKADTAAAFANALGAAFAESTRPTNPFTRPADDA